MLQSHSFSRRVLMVGAALSAAWVAAACGGSRSSNAGPSALPERGAVIRGRVDGLATGGGAPSTVSAATQGLKVSVVGTAIATSTNGAGEFVLTGVPSGRVQLRLEGAGVDARVEIAGLADGQEVQVTLRVSGDDVVLVSPSDSSGPTPGPSPSPEEDDDEVEFTGELEAISGSTLTVAGRTVVTSATTLVRHHGDVVPFSSLAVGQQVEVEGVPLADGSILAEKVTIEDDDGDLEDEDGDDEDHEDGEDGPDDGDDHDEDEDDDDGDDPDNDD